MLDFFKNLFYFFNPKEMIDLNEEKFKEISFDKKFSILSKELQEKFNPTFNLLEKTNNPILINNVKYIYFQNYKKNILTNLRMLTVLIIFPLLAITAVFQGLSLFTLMFIAISSFFIPYMILFFVKNIIISFWLEEKIKKIHELKDICLEHYSLLLLLEEVSVEYKEVLSKNTLKDIADLLNFAKDEKLENLIKLYSEMDYKKLPETLHKDMLGNSFKSIDYIVEEFEKFSNNLEKIEWKIKTEIWEQNSLYHKLKNPLPVLELDNKLKEYKVILEQYKKINGIESENLKIINKEYQLLLLQKIFILKNSLKLGSELREKGQIIVLDSYKSELDEQVKNLINLQMKIRNSVKEQNIKSQINWNLSLSSQISSVLK